LYHLRADSKAACKDWVITLNRIKEAHLEQGNVKLVAAPGHHHHSTSSRNLHAAPVDLLDTQSDDDFGGAPRVVVVSNRQRTRAVAESQDFDQLIQLKNEAAAAARGGELEEEEGDPATVRHDLPTYLNEKRISTMGAVVLTRWTKNRSSMSHLSSKLRTWARSLRHLNCIHHTSAVDNGLDKHVHPPGHDYTLPTTTTAASGARPRHAADNTTNRETSSGMGIAAGTGGDANIDGQVLSAGPGGSSGTVDEERSRPRRMSSTEDIRTLS
jgi:hypothetical protein